MDAPQQSCTLTQLVEQHYALLFRYAYRLCGSQADAEDLTQQAFLTAHAKLDQLRDPDLAKGWLCKILRNTFLKNVRGRQLSAISLEHVVESSSEPAPDIRLDQEELQEIINELPEEFRTPVVLFYFQEFSYKEIARQMDVPIGTVMSRLARGKNHLRKRLAAFQPAGSGG